MLRFLLSGTPKYIVTLLLAGGMSPVDKISVYSEVFHLDVLILALMFLRYSMAFPTQRNNESRCNRL